MKCLTVRLVSLWLLGLLAPALYAQTDASHLIDYHRNQYQQDLKAAVQPAYHYLDTHPYRWSLFQKPPAVVFDIDETLLSNWPELKQSRFHFHPKAWDAWVQDAQDKGIRATVKLYHALQARGYALILLTGRSDDQRAATMANLRHVGITGWQRLIMRQSNQKKIGACRYKAHERAKIYHFYRIVMNVGDQKSDFCGRHNGLVIKLPNPFYTIPIKKQPLH